MPNLSVAVTADVTDLQVKFAVAKAETSGLTSEMNKLARQSAEGIIDPAGQARLQQVAGDMLKAKAETAALSAEMKELSASTQGVGGVFEEMSGKMTAALQFSGVMIAVEAFNKLHEAISSSVEEVRQISAGADVLGVSVEQYQNMMHAAEEAGVGVDTLAHASEKLTVLLDEARNGSSAAADKLITLGVSTQQINNPLFNIVDLLGVEKERLEDGSTAVSARNALLEVLGTRMASAIAAIKEFDGSSAGLNATINQTNAYNNEQEATLKGVGAFWGNVGTYAERAAGKTVAAAANMLHAITQVRGATLDESQAEAQAAAEAVGPDKGALAQQAAAQQVAVARAAASETERINNEISAQGLANIKVGIEAFKDGTTQRLQQLQLYAAAAQQYYGSDTVDVVVKANQEIIAEQRKVDQAMAESRLKNTSEYDAAMNKEVELKLAAVNKELAADDQFLTQYQNNMAELVAFGEQFDTEVTNRHAQALKEMAAIDQKGAKDQATAWKGGINEIEQAEGTLVSDLLGKRKSLTQSLMAMSGQLVEKEITDDLKALTTYLFTNNQQKAIEQGGLLSHLFSQTQAATATATSQQVQTSATIAGNAARTSSTASAAASSAATSASLGSKTVMQDAAKAFSGVYASVAQIPYVGWILAPIAASAAFAGVAAYEGLASLDTGTNYVPRDMTANIHEGEAIVPKRYNPEANPAMAGAGGYSEEHNYHGDVNVSAFDAQSMQRMLSRPGGRTAVITGAMRSYRRGAR